MVSSKYNEKENNISGLIENFQELKKTDSYLFILLSEVSKIEVEGLQTISINTKDKNVNLDLPYKKK